MKSILVVLAILIGSNVALANKSQIMDKSKHKITKEQKEKMDKSKPNPEVRQAVEDCKKKVGFKPVPGQKPPKEKIEQMRSCMQEKMGRKPVPQKKK